MKQSKNLTTGVTGTTVKDTLRTAYEMKAQPRLIADWNYNRFSPSVTADNILPEADNAYDPDIFPISSIIEPIRSNKGILKARVGQAVVSSPYLHPKDPKFYVGSADDVYKYWTSPTLTDSSGNFPLTAPGGFPNVQPYIMYSTNVMANKIVIRFDNTWASPKNYVVQLTTNSGMTWSNVGGSNPAYDVANGILTLYYNGTAWVTTRPSTPVTTAVGGIRFAVGGLVGGNKRDGSAMTYKNAAGTNIATTGAKSSFNLISIEAHMEVDLSDRLITCDDDFEFSESSELYPIGTITSNQGNLTLDNTDGIFNYENTISPYYHLLDKNVEFNLEYIYTIGGTQHSVQQFHMYSEDWQGNEEGTVSVSVEDYSKFLKTVKPNSMFYENNPVTQIIWRVLDAVGFNNYDVQLQDVTNDHIIPVFWTDGEQTVWEILDDLAQASQTAIYFDGTGTLQVRTREAAFDPNRIPDWHLLGQDTGGFLADIATLEQTQEFEANTVNVIYKTTEWKTNDYGEPAYSIVWQTEDEDVVVRSTPLVETLGPSSMILHISQSDVRYWPYVSKVEIDGEIMQYSGKFFVYYTGTNGQIQNAAWVTTHDEYLKLNSLTLAGFRYKNGFTGHLQITERGIWNTDAIRHPVNAEGYTTKSAIEGSTTVTADNPVGFNIGTSLVGIATGFADATGTYWATRGTSGSTGYEMQGVRMSFPKGWATQRGGFGFRQNGYEENGYYVELTPSSKIANPASQSEVTLYSRVNRKWKELARSVPLAIAENIYYDVDAQVLASGGSDVISVYLNGVKVINVAVSGANKQPDSGKVSMYARGQSGVFYEYIYGAQNAYINADGWGFFDLKYGGMRSSTWSREMMWQIGVRYERLHKGHWGKVPYHKNIYFFDEFGPYVHEIREFDVKFDPAPVQYSTLYSSNVWSATPVEFYSSPFDAHFVIANTSRETAILQGDDNLTYGGTDSAISQVCVVLGRNLEIADDQTITVKDDAAVRRRGPIEVDLTSDWLQSSSMAQDVADWIVAHWGSGVDQLSVEIFGNPLIEVGDLVDIDFDEKQMSPATHRYFVTAVSNDFDAGIGTTLTLRRAIY